MEEIKVNDYIRTDSGIIIKVKKIEKDEETKDIWYYEGFCLGAWKSRVTKHSPNIIDLIEVGDMVEIFDVLHNDIIFIWNEEMLKALREDIENGIQIKTVTTKEKFNSIKYVIGE